MELPLKFSLATLDAKVQWNSVSKVPKEDYFEPRDVIKLSFSDGIITWKIQ